MKKTVITLLLACAITTIVAIAFLLGGTAHPAKAASSQQWDYAILVYSSEEGLVQWVEADPDRAKTTQKAMESLTKNTTSKVIPYIYYASLAGRLGWELILERDVNTVTALTFKRPLNE